jgi:hypothetical protein
MSDPRAMPIAARYSTGMRKLVTTELRQVRRYW